MTTYYIAVSFFGVALAFMGFKFDSGWAFFGAILCLVKLLDMQ